MAGALLGLAIMQLAATLGIWTALGISTTNARAGGMVIGALLAPTAIGAVLWQVAGALAALLLLVSYTPVVASWHDDFVRHDRDGETPPDAVVVLAGAVTSEGRVMGEALDRLLTGIAEARRRGIPTLALSIVADEHDAAVPSSERDQRELVAAFAPELSIRFIRDVHSTRDEALGFAALGRTYRWERALVITSPSHTRRACAAIEHAGLAVQCLPAVSRSYGPSRLRSAEDRRAAFGNVLYETAATLLYRTRGWM
jgi:uncharacterized SAM-binding protein YcdF (DUF218 family)